MVTNLRRPILTEPSALRVLRTAHEKVREPYPFDIDAMVVLPDHLHSIWRLPTGDSDFSLRWRLIKARFTRMYLAEGGREGRRSDSRRRQKERGIWQRRFWEHVVRDENEYAAYMDYVHHNPVKHGLVRCPHAWPHSSFHRWVREGMDDADWCCYCSNRAFRRPEFGAIEDQTGE